MGITRGANAMIELDNRYWDCECKHNYIHPKTVETCEICEAEQDEQPDSIVQEVKIWKENGRRI